MACSLPNVASAQARASLPTQRLPDLPHQAQLAPEPHYRPRSSCVTSPITPRVGRGGRHQSSRIRAASEPTASL